MGDLSSRVAYINFDRLLAMLEHVGVHCQIACQCKVGCYK